jgi:hypothetical protein
MDVDLRGGAGALIGAGKHIHEGSTSVQGTSTGGRRRKYSSSKTFNSQNYFYDLQLR